MGLVSNSNVAERRANSMTVSTSKNRIYRMLNYVTILFITERLICLIKFNCVSVLHTPIVHAHDVSKQISREKSFFVIFYFGILLLNNWLRLRWQFELNMESCQQADEEEMFSWNKIINALKHSRRNINPFTTFKPSVENVIKQLVHTSAVRSLRYKALGKFGEHARS